MADWKAELEKKVQELGIENKINFKKEEKDGQTISSARISDRDNSGSSRNVHRVSVHKEINNVTEKGGKVMITKEAALDDLEKIDVDAPLGKVVVEVAKILIKILATIRSNQLLTEEEKVKIREARKVRDAKETKK